ncbi:MAG: DUF4340 domain-containing protein [Planctomycetota bacterium]
MSGRNWKLFIAAALAWSLYLGLTRPWQGDAHARTAAQIGALYPQLPEQIDSIARIIITDGEQRATLSLVSRENRTIGRGWMVEEKNFPLDYARFTQMLDNLASIQTSDVVSVNPEKHGVYGVAEGQGRRVQIYSDDNRLLVDWIAGSMRQQDIQGGDRAVLEFYMRDARSDRVYLSGDAILPAVDPVGWCEVQPLKGIGMDRVSWIERKDFQTGESWRVERRAAEAGGEVGASSAWFMTEPSEQPALGYAGDSMATSIVGLKFADIIGVASQDGTDEARFGFPKDQFAVGIEGDVFRFELGNPTKNGQRFLRVKDLPYIFTLSDFEVSQLRQPVERMLQDD